MAHNLNYNEKAGEYSFVSTKKELPWHNLGQLVDSAMTSEEAIRLAHLDYIVDKRPLEAFDEDTGVISSVKGHFATVRNDTNEVLGVVKSRYHVVQNSQSFDFVDSIVGSKEAVFETAGALYNGSRTFLSAILPSNISLPGGEEVKQYIMLHNSHDGSSPIIAGMTNVRPVCNNTVNLALKNLSNKLVIRHTVSADSKLKIGLELMGYQRKYSMEFKEAITHLINTPINEDIIEETIKMVFLTPEEKVKLANGELRKDTLSTRKINLIESFQSSLEEGPGQDLSRGSAYWLLNGYTTFYNNTKNYTTEESRFSSIMDGQAAVDTQKVFNYLTAL